MYYADEDGLEAAKKAFDEAFTAFKEAAGEVTSGADEGTRNWEGESKLAMEKVKKTINDEMTAVANRLEGCSSLFQSSKTANSAMETDLSAEIAKIA